jgi:phosphomannomutase
MKETLKVGVSGVRGVVGDSFTPQLAASFAQAFGTFVGAGPVLVGRDTRPSGHMIERAVVAGLQSVGCRPVLAGIVPTPTVLFMTPRAGARGAIAITASHNPAEWNALKFADARGLFLDETHADALFDIYHQQIFPLVPESDLRAADALPDPTADHFREVLAYIDAAAVRTRRLKVAVDCCNGVGALHSPAFLGEHLGCAVVPVHGQPHGLFERGPEPVPENLGALGEAVRTHGCDLGFAQDPDGDRLAIVDESGEAIGEDLTLAFVVQQVLERHEKGPVAVNLTSSKAIDDIAVRHGCRVIRTKTGETHVAAAMIKEGAVVGGENTGGVMVRRIHPCRDSFSGMALVLEMLATSGKHVSELRAGIPRYFTARNKLPIRAEQAPGAIRAIRHRYASHPQNLLDGVRIDFGDSWVHVRRSNTESVLRIASEAPDNDEAVRLVEEITVFVGKESS